MIQLTKLDNTPILVNIEAIKYIEKTPDTLLFFNNGDRIIVRETLDQIQASVVNFQGRVLQASNTTHPDLVEKS